MSFKVFYEKEILKGKGDNVDPSKYSKMAIAVGLAVEGEHDSSKKIRMEIVLDHLAEYGEDYYKKLLSKIETSEIPEIAKKVGISEEDLWKWIES